MTIQHIQMVFDAEGLSHSEKVVLLAYCNYTDAHGYVWAGIPRISDDTGASESTIKRARKELLARKLMATKRRINPKTGQSTSNITRINLDLLASMKRAPREYDDNVIEELLFETESAHTQTPSDQRIVQSDLGSELRIVQSDPTPGVKMTSPKGQVKMTPNPSGEPSGSSSSGSAPSEEEEEMPSAPTSGSPSVDLVRSFTNASEEEAVALVEIIRPMVKHSLIGLIQTMAKNEDLDQQLWMLRRQRASEAHTAASQAAGPDKVCETHREPLDCEVCAIETPAVLRGLLKQYGSTRRPDIAARLAALTGASA